MFLEEGASMELSDEDSRLLSNRSYIEMGVLKHALTSFSSVLPDVCIPFPHCLSWYVQCLDMNKKKKKTMHSLQIIAAQFQPLPLRKGVWVECVLSLSTLISWLGSV